MQLDPMIVNELVRGFLAEDIGHGDVTTAATVPVDLVGTARIVSRGDAVIAGLDVARACFDVVGPGTVEWGPHVADGKQVSPGDVLVDVKGPVHVLLTAERTALNLLARLSAIATHTARFVHAVSGTGARIVDTRKTTPGLRYLEKFAVRVGGGSNHRFGLHDGILIKDNHIAAVGGIRDAVARARAGAPHGLKVEVEVEDLAGVDQAIEAGADVILLDNMTPQMTRSAVERANHRVVLESSGGITLDNVAAYASAGVDLIAIGALTHSAPSIDLTMEMAS